MIKRSVLALFIVLLFSSNQVGAQDVNIISGNQSNQPVQTAVPDTFPLLDLEETELDKIPDLRAQFEKLNSSYSSPAAPSENLLRFLKKDEIELSPEAQYWAKLGYATRSYHSSARGQALRDIYNLSIRCSPRSCSREDLSRKICNCMTRTLLQNNIPTSHCSNRIRLCSKTKY